MSLKQQLLEDFKKISTEKKVNIFLNEIITLLHDINTNYTASLVEDGVLSKDRGLTKDTLTDNLLKQVLENIRENIKLSALAKKVKEIEALQTERDNLKSKVERAQQMVNENKNEIEKSKKSTVNELKKKLQIGRDRIIAIAETSNSLGEQINNSGEAIQMIDTVNNIRDNLEILTNELSSVGLWDDDEIRPNTSLVVAQIIVDKPKRKPDVKKSTKKATKEVDESNELMFDNLQVSQEDEAQIVIAEEIKENVETQLED